MKKRIYVDSRVLQLNHQTGEFQPPIAVETRVVGIEIRKFYRVDILDPKSHDVVASVVYSPTTERQSECWIETENPISPRIQPTAMVTR